ncbi:MAG: hypothetical protein AAF502_13180 [Bacteroidota bacterium]
MKNSIIIFALIFGQTQISFSQVPADAVFSLKAEKQLEQTVESFFETIMSFGWDEGVATLKPYIDPSFRPASKGWMKAEFIEPLQFYLGQAYSSNQQSISLDRLEPLGINKGDLVSKIDGDIIWVFFKLPKGEIKERRQFDPMGNSIFYPCGIPALLKPSYGSLHNVFALAVVQKTNGQFKIFPDVNQLAGFGSFGTKGFKGSDEELQAIQQVADNFLKAIRNNDQKSFESAFANDKYIEEVWTDMRPLSAYRKLPEYLTHDLEFERILSFENRAGWRGQFSTHIAVYKLPTGMKASALRAPTDYFSPIVFPALDASNKDSGIKAKPGSGGFAEATNEHYDAIFLGPLIGTILGNEGSPEDYITVVLKRKPGTSNFNIGMPPSLK